MPKLSILNCRTQNTSLTREFDLCWDNSELLTEKYSFTYSCTLTNQNVVCCDVVMEYFKILKSFYSADDVTGYSADPIEVKNSSFLAKEIFQSCTRHKIIAN